MAQPAGEASALHVHRRITASSNSQILEEILRGRLDTGTGLTEPVQRRQTATSDSFGVERKPTGTSDDSFKRMLKTALFNSIVQPPHAGSEALLSMASMDLGGHEGALPGPLTSQELGLEGRGDDISDDESTDFIVLEKELRGFISSTGKADADTEPSMPTKSSGCYLTAPLNGIPEFCRLSLNTDSPSGAASQDARPSQCRDLQGGISLSEVSTGQDGNDAEKSLHQQNWAPGTAGPQLADIQNSGELDSTCPVSGCCVGGLHVGASNKCGELGTAASTVMSKHSPLGEGSFVHVGAADGVHNNPNQHSGSVPESQEHSPLMNEMLAQYGGQCTVGRDGNGSGLIHSRLLGANSSEGMRQFPEDCAMGESTCMHLEQGPCLQQAGCPCAHVCQPMEHTASHVSDAPGNPQVLHFDPHDHQDHICSGIPLQTATAIAIRHLDAVVADRHDCHSQQTILDSTVVRAPPARKSLSAMGFGTTHGVDETTREGSQAARQGHSLLSRSLCEPLLGDLRAARAEKSTNGSPACTQDQGGCLGQLPSVQCSSGKLSATGSEDGTEVSARKVKRKNTKGDKVKVESCERPGEDVAATPADKAMGGEAVVGSWSAMEPVIKQAQVGKVPAALPDLPPSDGYYEDLLKTMDVEMRLRKAEDKWREHDAGIKVLQGKISNGELGAKEGQEAVRKLYNRREAAASRSRREAELFQQVQQKRYLEQMESWLRQRLSVETGSDMQASQGVRRSASTGTRVAPKAEAAVGIDRSKAVGAHRLSNAGPDDRKAEEDMMHAGY